MKTQQSKPVERSRLKLLGALSGAAATGGCFGPPDNGRPSGGAGFAPTPTNPSAPVFTPGPKQGEGGEGGGGGGGGSH